VAQLSDARRLIAGFATQGRGSNDEARLRRLVSELDADVWEFDRHCRLRSGLRIFRKASPTEYGLVVMEGTGIAGGMALLFARLLKRARYVVSTGDAVGPYVASVHPLLGPLARLYERILYSQAAGVIGWSPYITGRALTMGARRAMTVPHWSQATGNEQQPIVRQLLGIPEDAIVVGVVGSLAWNRLRRYCYGLDLVMAVKNLTRRDMVALIIGDGSGMPRLVAHAGAEVNERIFLTGAVPPSKLHSYLAAMDLAVLSQSVDGVGAFRYTAKLSDYLQARVPVISTQVPAAYDIGADWMWRIAGDAPWDPQYAKALLAFLETLDKSDIAAHRDRMPASAFDGRSKQKAVTEFLLDRLAERA
jgi:glycosyltransferase involved in cell wall biosynthesis